MEPLNFCRQIKKYFSDQRNRDRLLSYMPTLPLDTFLKNVSSSIKFTLPPSGIILDDKRLKALEGLEELRLPYEHISLEFIDDTFKAVIVAYDHPKSDHILMFTWVCSNNIWEISTSIIIPKIDSLNYGEDGKVRVVFFLSRFWLELEPYMTEGAEINGTYAVGILLSFLNAMACSNVRAEKLPIRKSSKKDALPFDEYHVLTIARAAGNGTGRAHGEHRSPREHLRRGHVRHLSEIKKVWVNAAIVNAGAGGKIRKNYAVG